MQLNTAKNRELKVTGFEPTAFWSGVRCATVAPRSPGEIKAHWKIIQEHIALVNLNLQKWCSRFKCSTVFTAAGNHVLTIPAFLLLRVSNRSEWLKKPLLPTFLLWNSDSRNPSDNVIAGSHRLFSCLIGITQWGVDLLTFFLKPQCRMCRKWHFQIDFLKVAKNFICRPVYNAYFHQQNHPMVFQVMKLSQQM